MSYNEYEFPTPKESCKPIHWKPGPIVDGAQVHWDSDRYASPGSMRRRMLDVKNASSFEGEEPRAGSDSDEDPFHTTVFSGPRPVDYGDANDTYGVGSDTNKHTTDSDWTDTDDESEFDIDVSEWHAPTPTPFHECGTISTPHEGDQNWVRTVFIQLSIQNIHNECLLPQLYANKTLVAVHAPETERDENNMFTAEYAEFIRNKLPMTMWIMRYLPFYDIDTPMFKFPHGDFMFRYIDAGIRNTEYGPTGFIITGMGIDSYGGLCLHYIHTRIKTHSNTPNELTLPLEDPDNFRHAAANMYAWDSIKDVISTDRFTTVTPKYVALLGGFQHEGEDVVLEVCLYCENDTISIKVSIAKYRNGHESQPTMVSVRMGDLECGGTKKTNCALFTLIMDSENPGTLRSTVVISLPITPLSVNSQSMTFDVIAGFDANSHVDMSLAVDPGLPPALKLIYHDTCYDLLIEDVTAIQVMFGISTHMFTNLDPFGRVTNGVMKDDITYMCMRRSTRTGIVSTYGVIGVRETMRIIGIAIPAPNESGTIGPLESAVQYAEDVYIPTINDTRGILCVAPQTKLSFSPYSAADNPTAWDVSLYTDEEDHEFNEGAPPDDILSMHVSNTLDAPMSPFDMASVNDLANALATYNTGDAGLSDTIPIENLELDNVEQQDTSNSKSRHDENEPIIYTPLERQRKIVYGPQEAVHDPADLVTIPLVSASDPNSSDDNRSYNQFDMVETTTASRQRGAQTPKHKKKSATTPKPGFVQNAATLIKRKLSTPQSRSRRIQPDNIFGPHDVVTIQKNTDQQTSTEAWGVKSVKGTGLTAKTPETPSSGNVI